MSEKKMAIIATKGTLDWAYPPFILSSTAAALGYETEIFFTFYGLQLLKKELSLSVSPLGNPGAQVVLSTSPRPGSVTTGRTTKG
jgi:peroxiredoxin family protein